METILLNDPGIYPGADVLEKVLGSSYPAYCSLIVKVTDQQLNLFPEWRYYSDGKAWLCKVSYKKKTIFWLSVWDKYFRIVFYFTEKTGEGIDTLNVDKTIVEEFRSASYIGKLIPLIIKVNDERQINDALTIIEYKKALK